MTSLTDLTRMVRGLVLRGMVLASDASGVVQRLTVRLRDGEDRGPLEHWEPQGLTSRPVVGGRVLAARVGGREDDPVIICANDPSYRPTGLQPGETALYDLAGKRVELVSGKVIVVRGGATIYLGSDGLGTSAGVVTGAGVDPFTGVTYQALGNSIDEVRAG